MLVGYEYFNYGSWWNARASATFEGSVSLVGRSDWAYSKRTFEVKSNLDMPANWTLALRVMSGVGQGDIPGQTKYYFAGGSPLDEFSSPFFRSKGVLPSTVRDHSLFYGGGGMRGYYGFLPFGSDKVEAVNAEARFTELIPYLQSGIPFVGRIMRMFRSSLFIDAGRIASNPDNLWDQKFEVDWGFGIRLASLSSLFGSFSNSNVFSGIGLRTLRVDFPLFVSAPPTDEHKLKFRWVVGLSESF
jgi:hypothetical protein